ncbi:MAG TPA: hypothetical protein VIJ94_05570 [Caulobacteraceae bacterium]
MAVNRAVRRAIDVVIWEIPGHPRSRAVCRAMLEGILHSGDRAIVKSSLYYRIPEGRVGLFYGLAGRLVNALVDYPRAGRSAIYADLGYWKRKDGGRYTGYHKLIVNGRHPTDYFQREPHPHDRLEALELDLKPSRRTQGAILIAGMGPKGARAEGFRVNQWEQSVVDEIRKHTDRPIIYRPKPNWAEARPLEGASMPPVSGLLVDGLSDVRCVVSHHSNANVEALCLGVPGFTLEGPALPLSLSTEELQFIETPRFVGYDERRQWAADLAYTQFSIDEMKAGVAWRHLRDEGLVP